MTRKEISKLLDMLPEDSTMVVLVKSNVTMQIKDIQVVNNDTIMLIPFGMKPSDTLLQDFNPEKL